MFLERKVVTAPDSIRRHTSVPALQVPDRTATVTIVIPCYNYARYLPQAVFTALAQKHVQPDVIVVDDASTDDSLSVAQALAQRDERVTVIANRKNSGPVITFNNGLAQARGEFLVRLDADDMLTPGSLARAVSMMQAHPSIGLAYGHPLHFTSELPKARQKATGWTLWPGRDWLRDRCRFGYNVITSPEVLMRRSVVDLVGGQQDLAHTHDMEMWLRISAFSDVGYIHGADQALHRDHPDSLSARQVNALRDLLERRDAFRVLFSGIAGGIPEASEMHQTAMAAIAIDAIELANRQYDTLNPDLSLVHHYRDIAISLVPDPTRLRGWQGLEKRAALGPGRARRHLPFVAERIYRGLRGRYLRQRWHRIGV